MWLLQTSGQSRTFLSLACANEWASHDIFQLVASANEQLPHVKDSRPYLSLCQDCLCLSSANEQSLLPYMSRIKILRRATSCLEQHFLLCTMVCCSSEVLLYILDSKISQWSKCQHIFGKICSYCHSELLQH